MVGMRVTMRARYLLASVTLVFVAACGGPESPAQSDAAEPGLTTATEQLAQAAPSATALPPAVTETSAATATLPMDPASATPDAPPATPEPMPTETPLPEPTATPEPPPTETPLPAPTATPEPPTATPEPPVAVAEDLAPALGSIDNWYNSAPLALTDLIGNPVLLVFWADY